MDKVIIFTLFIQLIILPLCYGNEDINTTPKDQDGPVIHLAVVSCITRVEETLVMFRSALLQTRARLHFHVFADDINTPQYEKEMSTWKCFQDGGQASYTLHPIQLPKQNEAKWRTLWRPCASQRLFLPKLLGDVDALIYVDTDVLFMRPLDDIWEYFSLFNSTQLAALSPEHEPKGSRAGWYNRFARHPFYGELGLNSGVMLMNLTRMREVGWVDKMVEYYQEYNLKITWGDQDLINIFFHYYPERVYVYECEWNLRPDHCMYGSTCDSVEERGASVIHGNREVFHNEKQPAFKAVYEAFLKQGEDKNLNALLKRMEKNLKDEAMQKFYCGRVPHIFTKQLARQVQLQKKLNKKREKTEL